MLPDSSTRLNKYISESGICSRREADRFIEQGNVFINGKRATIGDQVKAGDVVKVNGRLIEPREADGRIEITAHDDGTDMILEIVDNGDGMDPALIRSALSGASGHHGRASIGLHNVDSRLRYIVGESYGLVVESPVTQGRGTRVRMRFPLEFDPCGLAMPLSRVEPCTTL